MRLTPRGEEVQAVVDIMESDGYDSGEKMAQAIIKAVSEFFWFREWYVLVIQTESAQGVFGPYASEAEALKDGALGANEHTKMWTRKVHMLAGPEQREGGGFGYCVSEGCGHPAFAHSMAGTSRGFCVLCGTISGTSSKRCEKYVATKPRATRSRAKKAA